MTPDCAVCCLKQERHNTGLPCVGLKGTVVSMPHSEHWCESQDAPWSPANALRLALLAVPGSFVNCLSWKNSCSPAVNTNSAPQSLHVKTLSLNSMAGFPKEGKFIEIAMNMISLPVPFPCLCFDNNQGPGRNKYRGK